MRPACVHTIPSFFTYAMHFFVLHFFLACCQIGKRFLIYGGLNGRHRFSDLWVYDTSAKTWTTPKVVATRAASLASKPAA